jgi:hypothetical protein
LNVIGFKAENIFKKYCGKLKNTFGFLNKFPAVARLSNLLNKMKKSARSPSQCLRVMTKCVPHSSFDPGQQIREKASCGFIHSIEEIGNNSLRPNYR